MTRAIRNLGLAALMPFALAGCGGGGSDGGGTVVTPPPTAATFQSKFGSSFESFFNTSNTTADASVKDPTAADVPALSLSTEPLDN